MIIDEKKLDKFETTLADVCRRWNGEELGWTNYIVERAEVLKEIFKNNLRSTENAYAAIVSVERSNGGVIIVRSKCNNHATIYKVEHFSQLKTAIGVVVAQTLYTWWSKYDEFLPACKATLTLKNL